jgi:hypothetical protein
MMEELQEPLDVMAEFMSPFEDQLDIVVLGDGIDKETTQELEAAFNNMRVLINEIPAMKSSPLGTVNMFTYNTEELYRGAATKQLENYCMIYLDPELSRQVVCILTLNDKDVDELDAMLLEKYILQQPQEKYILDISTTPDNLIHDLMANMDSRPNEFNYIIYGNLMSIWVYWLDEFTLIQGV